ncbi:SH3 domain-containing protein [Planktothrix agardhii 1032]|jgi:hypothetical protein|uniref:SH3 domain-containing protein n=1 Tax=Planktothrix agardhii TaxID=1160 RepID=UPI001D09A1BF|nr:SH3 domain-containing protein [Planktothrix agardhii]MCB8779315.1 SH3 domain-containing protein [Planktothrix agardhii 1031]MCF3597194.1 SH3 domain-containing protein [Planktothrix agardhii 1032]
MNNLGLRSKSFRVLALVVLAVMGSQLPTLATIQTKPTTPNSETKIAQNRSSLCRIIGEQQGLAVHSRPTPTSPVVGGVGFKTEVTLANNSGGTRGPDGRTWVEISAPIKGYISNGFPDRSGNLQDCSGQVQKPEPPTTQPVSLCRQIDFAAAPNGVVVREKPSRFSDRVGSLAPGARVRLMQNYRLIPDPNGEKRDWVGISEPEEGYISANTLIMCR